MTLSLAMTAALLMAATDPLADLRAALLAHDLEKTDAVAKRLSETGYRGAWEVRAALLNLKAHRGGWSVAIDADDARDINQALTASSPPPASPPDAPPFEAPTVGQRRYVLASALRLRAKPDTSAPINGELPIGTPVEARAVKGAWAQVKATVPAPQTLRFTRQPGQQTDPATAEGWALWRFLGPAASTVEQLQAQATALEASLEPTDGGTVSDDDRQDALAEAAKLLERATSLDGADDALRERALKAAVAAGQFDLAVRLVAFGAADWKARARVDHLVGCRGQRALATLLDARLGPKALTAGPNACGVDFDFLGACPPMDPAMGCGYSGSDCVRERAEYERAMAAYRKTAVARYQAHASDVTSAFPGPAFARFVVAPPKPVTVFAYVVPYTAETCQDSMVHTLWAKASLSTASITVPARTPTTVWVELPSPVEAMVGLLEAPTEAAARAQLASFAQGRSNAYEVGAEASAPRFVLPWVGCQCGAVPAARQ